MSASTQNQAFNALLFFYRHILKREFGKIEEMVRARRKPYIPVVLSREEINSILDLPDPPYDLVVKLLLTGIKQRENTPHSLLLRNCPGASTESEGAAPQALEDALSDA